MLGLYGVGAVLVGVYAAGQQNGAPAAQLVQSTQLGSDEAAQLFEQALSNDMSPATIVQAAEPLVALGADLPTASVIVAVAGLLYKLLQMATPFSTATAKWYERRLMEGPAKPASDPES